MNRPAFRLLFVLLLAFSSGTALAQTQEKPFQSPSLENEDAWTLVLFPDTQSYVKFQRNQPILDLMVHWVLDQIEPLQVELVLHVGDLVEHNALQIPDGIIADQTGREQWESVSRSMGKFDQRVPFIATTGNHDFGIKNVENRVSYYDRYFPIEKNRFTRGMLRDHGLDAQGMPTLINASYEFESPDGEKFLILVIEFAPRDASLEWARELVNREAYARHRVILLNHSYLDRNSEFIETEGYPISDRNYGKAVWEKLVKPSKNIELVFSGHIGDPDNPEGHVGFRTDTNAAGRKVHQMTFNAQALGGGWHGNGGDGWLRLLEFNGLEVTVKTFSPLFAISPATRHLAWGTGAYETFTFRLDP